MKKQIHFFIAMILIILPCIVNSQTVQIGLSPSLSHVLGGPYYSKKSNMADYPLPYFYYDNHIKNLGFKQLLGYQVMLKFGLKDPGIIILTQFEQQFLSNTDGATIAVSPASSLAYPANKVTGSLLAFEMGCGYRFYRTGTVPYLVGTLLFSRIGDIKIKYEYPESTIDEIIEAKNRLGLGCIFGVEWLLSKKLYLDAQFHLKSYALFMRKDDEDDFITTGLSVGLLYTLTSSDK